MTESKQEKIVDFKGGRGRSISESNTMYPVNHREAIVGLSSSTVCRSECAVCLVAMYD